MSKIQQVVICPSCGAKDDQKEIKPGSRKCGYCGTEYAQSLHTAMVRVYRAVSKKPEHGSFGLPALISGCLFIFVSWLIFSVVGFMLTYIFGNFIFGILLQWFVIPPVVALIFGVGLPTVFFLALLWSVGNSVKKNEVEN